MRILSIVFYVLVCIACAHGQCPCSGGTCLLRSDGWTQEGDWFYRYQGGHVVQARDAEGHTFMSVDGHWVPMPLEDGKPNFGVMREKMSLGEKSSVNGKPVSKAEMLKVMENTGSDLKDDSKFMRLTIIGTPEATAAVIKDVNTSPDLAPYKDQLAIQSYTPDSWAVAKLKPGQGTTIVVQSPTGEVLARQDDYADGAPGLALNLAAAKSAYDPTKNQDARASFDLNKFVEDNWFIGGMVAFVVFLFMKKPIKK